MDGLLTCDLVSKNQSNSHEFEQYFNILFKLMLFHDGSFCSSVSFMVYLYTYTYVTVGNVFWSSIKKELNISIRVIYS